MGDAEITLITPLAKASRPKGCASAAPCPPTPWFHARARAAYDVAICMYHDQALIPDQDAGF